MRYDGPPPFPGAPVPGPAGPPARPAANVLLLVGAALVAIWIVVATAAVQASGWFIGEVALASGLDVPAAAWLGVAAINAAVVAAPAGVLWAVSATLRRENQGAGADLAHGRFLPAVHAATRAWTVAGIAGGVLGAVRAIPAPQNEILLLVAAAVAAASALLLWLRHRSGARTSPAGTPPPGTLPAGTLPAGTLPPGTFPLAPFPAGTGLRSPWLALAVAGGLLVLLPWFWAGALGGLSETLLAVLAAAAFGWLAATLVGPRFLRAFDRSRVLLVLGGGFSAAVALAPLGAGLGGRGVNLAELLLLPPLGFVAAALAAAAPGLRATAVAALFAVGAVGPLAFVDPEETSLLLGFDDVGRWALDASLISVGVGLLLAITYGFSLSPRRTPPRWLPAGLALLAVASVSVVYGVAGRPGLYGDRLFVVLADQADLTGLDAIADRPARLQATYRRLVDHAEASQASLRESLDRWGLDYTPYYLVNGILVDGGPVVRQWLAGRDDVDRVLLDQRLRPLPVAPPVERGSPARPAGTPQWNVAAIQAPRVWSQFDDRGAGIVIGTSDSGVDGRHPDLAAGYRGGDDSWFDPWNGTSTPTAHNGHGTHTIGTALGRNGIGVAPEAQWIACVNLDRNLGSPSRYLDCLQFMMAPFPIGGDPWRDGRPDRAPHVLTNSWGCPDIEGCDASTFLPATAAFKAAGIYFVAAAGNTGPFCDSVDDPPAPYRDVLTVGAVNEAGQVADFSSRGPVAGAAKPDLVAPGVDVLSALPDGTYGTLSGTSMATPHVAGVVALMWSANPALIGDIDATTRILLDTATPISVSSTEDTCGSPRDLTGAGEVDAYAAVSAARAVR